MNETVLPKEFRGIPVEFVFEKDNKYSRKKSFGANFLFAGFKFAMKMVKNDRNTVYVTHEEETGFGLWLMGKRYIIFSHLQGARLEEKLNNGEKVSFVSRRIIKFAEKTAFKNALCVCFPSKGAYGYYINSPYRGADKEDFRLGPVVYNTLYLKHKPEKFAGIEADEKALTLLSVGSLTTAKGIDRVPGVLEEILKKTDRKIRYILVGKGILQPLVEKKLDALSAAYKNFTYHLINRCSVGEMPYLQQLADVYIMLHRISVFDLATLEMMDKAKMIVLSKVGGNPEFDVEGNIVFWDGDDRATAAAILSADPKAAGALNKKVYDRYFGHEAYRRQYDGLLERLVAGEDASLQTAPFSGDENAKN